MKIFFSTIPFLLLSACSNADNSNQYEFNDCGKSKLNGKIIQKKCATQDIQAKKISKDYTPKILQTIIGAGHTINHEEQSGFILKFKNEEFNMQSHIWDFSKQDASLLVFKGHDSIISNGVVFGEKIILGGNYIPPNFTTNNQPNNISLDTVGFLYANNQYDCNSVGGNNCDDIRFNIIENLYINKIKIAANSFSLSSWGGGIINSTFLINNITIEGSKAFFKNNQIFSQAKLLNKKNHLI